MQICISPSRCFLLSLDIEYYQVRGVLKVVENILYVPCSLVSHCPLCPLFNIESSPLVEKVMPHLTPRAAWFLVGHRNMFAFLCVASTSAQIGIVSSSCYLFSCSAMLDKSLCEAIVTSLFGKRSEDNRLLLRSPVEVGKYCIVVKSLLQCLPI